MKIRFTTWLYYCVTAGFIVLPLVLLDFIRPAWWHETEQNISSAIMILIGLSGAVMAILRRMGKIEFIYSDKDENT